MEEESLIEKRILTNFMRILKEYFGNKPGKLADALDVKPSFISDVIHKRRNLTTNYIERISELIKIDPIEFYKGPTSKYVTEQYEVTAVQQAREAKKLGDDVVNQVEAVTEAVINQVKKTRGLGGKSKTATSGIGVVRRQRR